MDVPTSTPMPSDEISCNCDGERVNASGNEPTTKDLLAVRQSLEHLGNETTYVMAITMLKASKVSRPCMVIDPRALKRVYRISSMMSNATSAKSGEFESISWGVYSRRWRKSRDCTKAVVERRVVGAEVVE